MQLCIEFVCQPLIAQCVSVSRAVVVGLRRWEWFQHVCDSQGHFSVFGWRFPCDSAHASQCLRFSDLGVCASSEEASVRTLFPQRTTRSGVWHTTAIFFFFVTAFF